MAAPDFEALQLHDAILRSLLFNFQEGTVTVVVNLVGLSELRLVFLGVTAVEAPRKHPWGPSASINALRRSTPSRFEFEMQSGDLIVIEGNDFSQSVGTHG